MTLFKQVALIVSLVFFLIVITTTVGDFRRSGTFLEGQLKTAAQDMATTLGVAISNSASDEGIATYETLFNAVFDSGYYSSIELIAPDGEVIHKKSRKLEIQGVPNWFVTLVPLSSATGSTQVMQGWIPLGTLQLTLHPGYVYSGLYKNLEATLIWFIVLFSFGMIILWLLLHKIMKPLKQVKQQADAIHNNQFVQQTTIPSTVELRTVVEAMNRMVGKVQMIFDDQESTLTQYQKLLYEDSLTGLGNRQYFMSRLERSQSDDTSFHGSLAVIKLHHIDYVRDHFGYEKSDTAIKTLADILKQDVGKHANEQCGRLADEEFALLLPADSQPVVEHVQEIFDAFQSSKDIAEIRNEIYLTAGITNVHVGRTLSDTLAESDFALTQATESGPYSIKEKASTNIELPQGKMKWRAWLENSIEQGNLFLVRQKVLDTNNKPIHQEIFVRLKNDDNQIVPAGMFMPMANALGMGEDIDRTVFKLVKALGSNTNDIPVALNLTISVFTHADALVEFNQLLHYFQQSSSKLCVEASHSILEQYPAMCTEVAESVRKAGHSFAVDNLNLGRSLQALQSVRPDYVKVNAKTLYDMTVDETSAGYQALRTLTNTMDIQIIAVGVDSQALYDHLRDLGVSAMQGNLLSESEEIV